jgi:SAM-dependent methyltransferase
MRSHFPFFQSHLDLAHDYWRHLVAAGDCVIDATCGNGHDSLLLAQLALTPDAGRLYALDIQPQAIAAAQMLVSGALPPAIVERIAFCLQSHAEFPADIAPASVKLIVYNLGYLPGGDKAITTSVESTVASILAAQELLLPGGVISITCYPGHAEGAREEDFLISHTRQLPPQLWSCTWQRWINRRHAPSLLLLQKGAAPSAP